MIFVGSALRVGLRHLLLQLLERLWVNIATKWRRSTSISLAHCGPNACPLDLLAKPSIEAAAIKFTRP